MGVRIISREDLFTSGVCKVQKDTSMFLRMFGFKPYKNITITSSLFGDFHDVEYVDVRMGHEQTNN